MLQKIIKHLQNKKHWIYRNIYYRLTPRFFYTSPYLMATFWYAYRVGKLPNLLYPKNVNELWMSINLKSMKNPKDRALRIKCADKYAVRQYVIDKGFGDILNECYGVHDSFDEIDFDSLPNQFVLKMTTGSGMNFICRDKGQLDIETLRSIVENWYQNLEGFGLKTAEWHYVEIKPRLIVEKYLSMLGESLSLVDYKFHCFNGKIYHIETIYDRDVYNDTFTCDAYTVDWERKDVVIPQYQNDRRILSKPQNFEHMKRMAEVLSADFEYVRVDMYEVDGKVLFGELTFTPAGCIDDSYRDNELEKMCNFYYDTKIS